MTRSPDPGARDLRAGSSNGFNIEDSEFKMAAGADPIRSSRIQAETSPITPDFAPRVRDFAARPDPPPGQSGRGDRPPGRARGAGPGPPDPRDRIARDER